jgi:hypothetical protein
MIAANRRYIAAGSVAALLDDIDRLPSLPATPRNRQRAHGPTPHAGLNRDERVKRRGPLHAIGYAPRDQPSPIGARRRSGCRSERRLEEGPGATPAVTLDTVARIVRLDPD